MASTTWSPKPTTGVATGSAKVRAPRVNPYAAPQTIDRPVKTNELPVASFAESDGTRQMFPEQSTEVLAAMVRRTEALNDAQVVWFLVTLLLGLLGGYWIITASLQGASVINAIFYNCLPVIGAAFAFIRWNAGNTRNRSDRYYVICMDCLLFALSLGLGVWLLIDYAQNFDHGSGPKKWGGDVIVNMVMFLAALPFLIYPGYYSLRSLQALDKAQPLFGPERLNAESLKKELAHRQLHKVE